MSNQLVAFLLLICTVLAGVFFVSWFEFWVGLELNMFCYIFLLGGEGSLTLTYFVVQGLGSIGYLWGGLLVLFTWLSVFMVFGILLKLGSVPFHWWLLGFLRLRWWLFFLLLSVQKFLPLQIAWAVGDPLMMEFGLMSMLVGSVIVLTARSLFLLLIYSSIVNLGFILVGCMSSFIVPLIYVALYVFILYVFLKLTVRDISFLSNGGWVSLVMFFLLGGLPPFLGFWGKWMIFLSVGSALGSFSQVLLLLSSFLIFYFYLKNVLKYFWFDSVVRLRWWFYFLFTPSIVFYI